MRARGLWSAYLDTITCASKPGPALLRASGELCAQAVRTVLRLCEDDFLSSDDPEWEGVLRHALYHRGRGLGVDESVMWGDYFFLDALHSIQEGIK